jgi:hypothetical protein
MKKNLEILVKIYSINMSYNISNQEHDSLTKYFESLIYDEELWIEFEEECLLNFTKIYELFSSKQRDDIKVRDIKQFLRMYSWEDEEGLLARELPDDEQDDLETSFELTIIMWLHDFSEYYEDEHNLELSFNLTMEWLIGYIDSGVWIV